MLELKRLTWFKMRDSGARAVVVTMLKRAGFLVREAKGGKVSVSVDDPHGFHEAIKPYVRLIVECKEVAR